ncbi:hypothetical protein QBC38DRAFT_268089 [Podospora fimiseda]|uniref:C3H1-type domain-containing protein n=1 Tax=Podospora fimiseda TaxID=252190 RepID=A0AAN7BKU5_9PEZI|nr:hypothetical protein QBC38DRAFT_268089 [Podospora fimiseda]
MATSNLAEFRHLRTGSLNIPPQQTGRANPMMVGAPAAPIPAGHRFGEGSRSPPNTGHVPCKFFRQGACQAGNTCPFSHDLSTAAENVCKYFAKGNCKFGPKCANIHVLPDGRRINYGKNGVTIGGPHGVALGARVNPNTYHQPASSALTDSFRADSGEIYPNMGQFAHQEERFNHQPNMEGGVPTIDTTYSSNPASAYGSPRNEETNRFGLGLSPAQGLSVLDAPLPPSFDSNGYSNAARFPYPWSSSVPAKMGLDSPSPSLRATKIMGASDALKKLHSSAFGNEHLSPSGLGAYDGNGFGSSPPTGSLNIGSALGEDEYFGKRAMHSSSSRFASKARMMSNSVPRVDRDWDADFLYEEECVPGIIAEDVLTSGEKVRRGSTANSVRMIDNQTLDIVAESCPPKMITKYGSPVPPSSPGRWAALWGGQPSKKDEEGGNSFLDATRSVKHTSAFGHVGSPLRNSSLASAMSNLDGGAPISALTQQLRETQISDNGSAESSPHLRPNVSRNGAGVIGESRDKERGLERHTSSNSIGSSVSGRFKSPMEEEDSSFVFSMEDEDDSQVRAKKRTSGGNQAPAAASPLSSAWSNSYATVVANNRGPATTNGNSVRGNGAVEAVGGR